MSDADGSTPLMFAALKGDLKIVKPLVLKGADVNAAATDGRTALSNAKKYKRKEVVTYLKLHGAK